MYRVTRKILLGLILCLPLISYGQEVPVSAMRGSEQSWQEALARQSLAWKNPNIIMQLEILNDLLLETAADISGLPEWNHGIEALNSLNVQARGSRRYPNPNPGNFQRRAAWLFPVDGCYAKAAHVSAEAAKRGYPKPGKVFAYGDLEYATQYARNGRKTYWSYHVAAAYRVSGQVYVLDPMISPKTAMTLSTWLSQISDKPSAVKVKLCDSKAYSPHSKCRGSRGNGAYTGHMRSILVNEWNNLKKLGYSPTELLGPAPSSLP